MKTLLEQIKVINYKYSLLEEEECFNIFEILRKIDDEVQLHSKFLSELLDMNASHKMGNAFAKEFLNQLGIKGFGEDYYKTYTEYKNIDILLASGKQAIFIENKIWAEDRDRQITNYYNKLKDDGFEFIYILYLTPDGKEPDEKSYKGLEISEKTVSGKVLLLSYDNDILEWLDKCIEISARKPIIRETIIQYQNIIKKITGKTISMEEKNKIIDLLAQNDNIISARKIYESWEPVKMHTELLFWSTFEKKINESKEFKVSNEQKYCEKQIQKVVDASRNKSPWYGLSIDIGEYKSNRIYLVIERTFGNAIFGVKSENNVHLEELKESLKSLDKLGANHVMAARCHLEPKVNLHKFADKGTLKLINEEECKKQVDIYYKQIKSFIEECRNILKI